MNSLGSSIIIFRYHCFTFSSSCPATISISVTLVSQLPLFSEKGASKIGFSNFWKLGPHLNPLNLRKMTLKNIILACLESSPSMVAVKKVCSLSLCLFLKLSGFKNAVSFKISKKKHFSLFSAAYCFLIDFPKVLQFLFPYSQRSLLDILSNWEHGIGYISQNWWSNFHEILILLPKSHKNRKKYHNSPRKRD